MQESSSLSGDSSFAGRVEWIGVSPERRAEIQTLSSVVVEAGTGLVGDYHAQSGKSKRQVTLVQAEDLRVVASLMGIPEVRPDQVRRNLMISGINIHALGTEQFRIGSVLLEGTGPCPPCIRMDENLGPGGRNAMRGHGGITAIVLEGGTISVGDTVTALPGSDSSTAPACTE